MNIVVTKDYRLNYMFQAYSCKNTLMAASESACSPTPTPISPAGHVDTWKWNDIRKNNQWGKG